MHRVNPFVIFLIKRIGVLLVTFFVAITVIFLLPRLIPGNPLATLLYSLVAQGAADPEKLKAVERSLLEYFQLDRPIYEQYINFLTGLLRGDLGKSIMYFPRSTMDIVARYLPWTLYLLVPAIVASWTVGNTIGVVAAINRGKWVDKLVLPVLAVLQGIPPYIFGMYLVLVLGVQLKVFPTGGTWSPTIGPSLSLTFILDYLYHYVLPFLSIFLTSLAGWGLSMRNISIQELATDYMDYARTLALSQKKMVKYLFKCSSLPQIVGLAIVLGWSVAGSVITEIVFNYQGIGFMFWRAVQSQDYILIQGFFVIIIGTILLANFISEIIFSIVDPRVRYAYVGA
uniref:ABC transporter permease n=1 Tax=Ignisphaera aggregans TaxID=334771 RepID=A0A7J3Z815_9CREN